MQPHLLHCLFDAEPCIGKAERHRLFFPFYHIQKIAFPAADQFLRVSALDFPAAERSCNDPAGPACHFPFVYTMIFLMHGNRADPDTMHIPSARLPPALFVFPAVDLGHNVASLLIVRGSSIRTFKPSPGIWLTTVSLNICSQ